jgi:hypothetical protein
MENLTLTFIDIQHLTFDKLSIDQGTGMELYSFDYRYRQNFECKLIFLPGFSKASFQIVLTCERIELQKHGL